MKTHDVRAACQAGMQGVDRDTRLLIGVSGGSDSVALLYLLHEWMAGEPGVLGVAHLNHGIRDEVADADEAFVRDLAAHLNRPCHTRRVDVPALSKANGLSTEMAARAARQAFFADCVREHGYELVVLAHTRDDQAETLLLRLLRGAGASGLSAMAPETTVDGVRYRRPLLSVSKADVRAELERRGAAWREDTSNADPVYLRNRVRNRLVPLLQQEFNPNIVDTLARTATILRDEDREQEQRTDIDLSHCVTDRPDTLDVARCINLSLVRRRRVIRRWLLSLDTVTEALSFDAVERVLDLCTDQQGTAQTPLEGGGLVRREYDRLLYVRKTTAHQSDARYRVPVPGTRPFPEWGIQVRTVHATGYERPEQERCGQCPASGWLSARAVGEAPLYVRTWRAGDRFSPYGLSGTRKVQDIFVDRKVPRESRTHIPLIECNDEIVWIPGYRVAAGYAVEDPAAPSIQVAITTVNADGPRTP